MRQVDLALALKIPPSKVSEIVCERRQADPSLRARIAQILCTDEAWLFSCVIRIPKSSPLKANVAGLPTFDESAQR